MSYADFPAAGDIVNLTDKQFAAKYGVTADGDLTGDIDDLRPPARPMIDVTSPLLDGPEAA